MKLNQLTPTERISLIGGQLHSIFMEVQKFAGERDITVTDKLVETALADWRNRCNRIIDLIEESNNHQDKFQ